jgi:hypothetical protein
MYNRVKFVINKIFFQTNKNKNEFVKIKKYNKNNFNSVSTRKFSSYSNKEPPNDPFNKFVLFATIFCGSLLVFKKNINKK